jgi:hypothetical protein
VVCRYQASRQFSFKRPRWSYCAALDLNRLEMFSPAWP